MNNLSREKQTEIIAALCDGLGVRAITRITGVNRKTVGTAGAPRRARCAELHDRMMVGIRVNRLELDEAWSYVAQALSKKSLRHQSPVKGDSMPYRHGGTQKCDRRCRMANATTRPWRFLHDLRQRVIGQPEISTDGCIRTAIRSAMRSAIAPPMA